MIDIRFKECCSSCSNLEVQYEQVRGLCETLTVIGCSHACVCRKYHEDSVVKKRLPPRT